MCQNATMIAQQHTFNHLKHFIFSVYRPARSVSRAVAVDTDVQKRWHRKSSADREITILQQDEPILHLW